MSIKKNDFVEIDFTGKLKETNEIFDTTNKTDAKNANLNIKEVKPFIMCVGHKMLPVNFDNDLIGKDIGKDYSLELTAKDAFGERQPKLVKMVPTKLFLAQKINPQRGMQLSLDGQMVRIVSVSGGRTLVDFNSPLAGKDIIYNYKILREVKKPEEKVNSLQDFLFRTRFPFQIVENTILFSVDPEAEKYIKMFEATFKELSGLDVQIRLVDNKK